MSVSTENRPTLWTQRLVMRTLVLSAFVSPRAGATTLKMGRASGLNLRPVGDMARRKFGCFPRGSTMAFTVPSCSSRAAVETNEPFNQWSRSRLSAASSSRLFFSWRNNNQDEKPKNFLERIGDAAKSILPQNWGKDEETKKAEIRRRERDSEITGGLREMLKDAPLPVKMMGAMVAPLMSSMASGLAEAMEQQSRQMEDILDEARDRIIADSMVLSALGGDPGAIQVGTPFSQSSSTSSINGRTTTRVQAIFPVMGSRGAQGTATLDASGEGIQSLRVDVGGRSYSVDLLGKRKSAPKDGSTRNIGRNSNIRDADIIDAEFVEKKTD